jgi:hypothetical protein
MCAICLANFILFDMIILKYSIDINYEIWCFHGGVYSPVIPMFLRNVGIYQQVYKAPKPTRTSQIMKRLIMLFNSALFFLDSVRSKYCLRTLFSLYVISLGSQSFKPL